MAEDRMAVLDMLRKATADGDVDVLREGVRVLAEAIMEAEVSELTGVAKGERAPDRRLTNRNGYRERRWDTRVGTIAWGSETPIRSRRDAVVLVDEPTEQVPAANIARSDLDRLRGRCEGRGKPESAVRPSAVSCSA